VGELPASRPAKRRRVAAQGMMLAACRAVTGLGAFV